MIIVKTIGEETVNFKKNVYRCSYCGNMFNWNKDSSWYGSYADLEDNPRKIKYACSDQCVDKLKE